MLTLTLFCYQSQSYWFILMFYSTMFDICNTLFCIPWLCILSIQRSFHSFTYFSSSCHFRPALSGTQPSIPVPPATQNPMQPTRPLQTVWPGDVGQPLHPHCGVFWWTPWLTELPLWWHLHPPALLTLTVIHAFAKLHPHTSNAGQERLQNPGYFHLPETVLRQRPWERCCSWLMLVQQRFGSICRIPELFVALWLLSRSPCL